MDKKTNKTVNKAANKTEPVTKPTLVARQEFLDNLVALINGSGLPLIVVQPVLDGVMGDVQRAIRQQYENEKAQYESAVAVENGK